MFNFGGITHVILNPSGARSKYSLVGSVSSLMLDACEPTTADVMGGRVAKDGKAYHGRIWPTVQTILDEAGKHAGTVKMCDMDGCACRSLFKLVLSFESSYTKQQLQQVLKGANCLMPERMPRANDKAPVSFPTMTGCYRLRRDPFNYSHKKPMYIWSIYRWEVVIPAPKPPVQLVDAKTGRVIVPGDTLTDFRGETWKLVSFDAPTGEGKAGYVYVTRKGSGEMKYYPTVFGCKIIPSEVTA